MKLTQIEELFLTATELQPGERAEFLAHLGDSDPAAATTVRSLLQHHLTESESDNDRQGIPRLITDRLAEDQGLLLPGANVDDYRIVQLLGSGGMGDVFLAREEAPIQREVALKVLKLQAHNQNVLQRFAVERQVLAGLRHPGIPRIHNAGQADNGRSWLAMEYIPGTSITQFCEQQSLSLRERIQLFIRLCDTVSYIHAQGIIHRDIKPSNVLVAESDGIPVPFLVDFGIACVTQSESHELPRTDGTTLLGTMDYMSPEQFRPECGKTSAGADIWSLGVLLYELMTGSAPFADCSRHTPIDRLEEMRVSPVQPSTKLIMPSDDVSVDCVDAITLDCLQWLPENRPQSVTALSERLSDSLQNRSRPRKNATPDKGGRRIIPFIISSLAVALLMLMPGSADAPAVSEHTKVLTTEAKTPDPAPIAISNKSDSSSVLSVDAEVYAQIEEVLRQHGMSAEHGAITVTVTPGPQNNSETGGVTVVQNGSLSGGSIAANVPVLDGNPG